MIKPDDAYCSSYVPKGWESVVNKLCADITEAIAKRGASEESFKLAQVKSKFAGLRFYYDLDTEDEVLEEEIRSLVRLAEKQCASLCEQCGKKGELRGRKTGWIYIGCEDCETDRNRGPAND